MTFLAISVKMIAITLISKLFPTLPLNLNNHGIRGYTGAALG